MKRLWSTKKWLIGLVVLAVVLMGVGITVPAIAAQGGAINTGVYLDSPTLTRLAAVLGVSPAELSTQLQTGKTLAAIATEKNIPASKLIDAIIAPQVDQVALSVKYGYITQEQSQAILDAAKQRAGYLLEQNLSASQATDGGYFGQCGNWGGGFGGYGMGPGMMRGWGGNYNNPAPGVNSSTTPGGAGFQGRGWNGGWGMMGGRW